MANDLKTSFRKAFDRRCSIREYTNQDISKEDMEFILDSAWLSPSSIGLEPWRFIVLDRHRISQLAPELKTVAWGAQKQLDSASHIVILIAQKDVRYDSDNVKKSLQRRGLGEGDAFQQRLIAYERFQKSDTKVADSPRTLFDWASKQTYIALANLMTTAAVLGVDSCAIEGFDYQKVTELLADKNLITPDTEGISCMLSLGYRAKEPAHSRIRKPRQDVITWLEDL